ncbi:MAG TPA: hypothetical protein VMT18_01005, partial [Planctomycetota bacterium]|nr:hypothetical protein [Planctomycetota bacterium]
MKRVLFVTLAVFLVGLGVLLWIDRTPGDVLPLPEPPVRGPSPEAGQGEVVEVPDDEGRVTQVTSSGPLSVTDVYADTGVRRYRLTAEDHRSLGEGAADLERLRISLYDTDGVTLLRDLQAARGRVTFEFVDGRPRISEAVPGTFEDVTVTLAGISRFAPVTLEVPEVTVEFARQVLRSERDVLVTGRGLRATGSGLFAEGERGSLQIERSPEVTLEFEDGTQATLVAAGPLSLENRPDLGPEVAAVRAQNGATLTLSGGEPLSMRAQEVRLIGRTGADYEGFAPERVEAEGTVELERTEGRFLGDRGLVTFTDDGRPRRGELRGSPRAFLELHGVGFEGRERVQDPSARLPIEARGRELLTVDFGAGLRFELDGPATVTLPSLATELVAQRRITGIRDPSGGYDTVTAEGGVTVISPTETLRAETVDVEALGGGNAEVYARATTRGPTHAQGVLEQAGERFALDAEGGLVYVRTARGFSVPRASEVTLDVLGPDTFRAGAREVRDLDGLRRTFVAEGEVWYEGAQGRARGERLDVEGPRQAVLTGTDTVPARFTLPQGELEALRVEVDGQRLHAEGQVEVDVAQDGVRLLLSSRWLELDEGRTQGGGLEGSDWRLDAGGEVHAVLEEPAARREIRADLLSLRADEGAPPDAPDGQARRLVPISLEAVGHVVADTFAGFAVHAEGERLFFDAQRNALLTPADGERVRVVADDPVRGLHLELDADAVEYGLERLVALRPELTVDGLDLPVLGGKVPNDEPRLTAVAGRMSLDRGSMLLSEGAYVARVSPLAQGWSLDADQILMTGDPERGSTPRTGAGLPLDGPFDELYAWGGFVASGAEGLQARGERLAVSGPTDRITITGAPATVIGNGVVWNSDWFELDGSTRSIRSSSGQMRVSGGGARGPWVVRYASMEPIETEDTTIQVLREPVLAGAEEELRGSWALFWIDSRRWQRMSGVGGGGAGLVETGEQRAGARAYSLFGEVEALGDLDWLREFYMEGNVEYIVRGERRARAGAIYLDLVDGQGWVREADIETDLPIGRGRTPIKVRAEWLRHSADGVYRAENAVATTCTFEDPHYVVRIGSFGMRPRSRARRNPNAPAPTVESFDGWDVEAKRNRLILWRNFGIPLPKVGLPTDKEYKVETDSVSVFGMRPFSFGSDAKFGTFVGTSFAFDLSWLVKGLGSLFRGLRGLSGPSGPSGDVQGGKGDLNVRWFNRRGLLLGVELPIYDPGRFWLDSSFSGIFDTGDDRGLVRVPEDERSVFRGWLLQRGRYLLDEREWIDYVLTYQTDAGVQSEFFEGEYLEFEERETYVHWRKSKGDQFVAATLEGSLEDFRTEIQEQPAAIAFDGTSQVASMGPVPVYYGSKTTVGRYERTEDSSGYESPFPDGLGERTVNRFDTLHHLESPLDLGWGGLTAVPFVEGRLSAWDEGADVDEQPMRAGILAGAVLSTTFFRAYGGGARHAVTPSVGVRTDLATAGDGEALIPIDTTEIPLEGTFTDFSVRSRWTYGERRDSLDLGLTATHVSDSPALAGDDWAPGSLRGTWFSTLMGVPFVVSADVRYDPDDHTTVYSRTLLGFEPIPTVDVELGHDFGRDPVTLEQLFDAATVGARYLFSPKWEVEARQTISSQGDGRLASSFGVTRIGHDFVFEFDSRFVAGEGQSISVKLT